MSREDIQALKEAYRLVYRSDLNRSQAIEEIRTQGLDDNGPTAEFMGALTDSERGRRGRGREGLRTDVPVRRKAEGDAK
jgi:acyl-[acyl carrier protein]--UDP-N-acetylglucosamine O-acyltransferase